MTNDSLTHQKKIDDAILDVNSSLESIWNDLSLISYDLKIKNAQRHSIKRLLTYNPLSKTAFKIMPSYEQPMEKIFNGIKTCLDNIILEKKDDINTWALIGKLYFMIGDFPNAYSSFAHVLRIDKNINDPAFWMCIGCVYQHFDFNKEAKDFFKNVNDKRITDSAEYKLRLALACRALNEYKETEKLLVSIEKTPPNGLNEDDISLQIYYTYQCAGDINRAVEGFNRLRNKYPNNIHIIHQWLWTLSFTEDYNKAKDFILKNKLTDPTSKFFLGRIELLNKQLESSYELFSQCLHYCSEWPVFWFHLGSLYYINDQFKDASVAFQRGLFLNGELEDAWLLLASSLEEQKDFNDAKKILETANVHCVNNEKIAERLKYLKSTDEPTHTRLFDSFPLEITHIKYHVQTADRHCETIVNTPPLLDNIDFCNNADLTYTLTKILQPYESLFQD